MTFDGLIVAFNCMYDMPTPAVPTTKEVCNVRARLLNFVKILQEELSEVDDILQLLDESADEADVLTAMADWLGDIQVYCASEI